MNHFSCLRLPLASLLVASVVLIAAPSAASSSYEDVFDSSGTLLSEQPSDETAAISSVLDEYESLEQALLEKSIDPTSVRSRGMNVREDALKRKLLSEDAVRQAFESYSLFVEQDLSLSSLQYKNPSVELELQSSNRVLDAELRSVGAFSDRDLPGSENPTFVRFRRTASIEIDLTGATDIQGFDPSEPLRSGSADTFIARVVRNRWSGDLSLVDVNWVTTEGSAYDRPIGWGGNAIVLSDESEFLEAGCSGCSSDSWIDRQGGNVTSFKGGEPDSTDEVSATATELESPLLFNPMTRLTSTQKQEVVDYARKYAENPNEDFKKYGNDCTNFISQSLQAGGWTTITNHNLRGELQQDLDSWHYRHITWAYPESLEWATYSWTGVDEFFEFARNRSGRTWSRGNIWKYEPGEILQADLGNDNDTDKDHSVVYTAKWVQNNQTQVLISYHTNDRVDKDLRWFMGNFPNAEYYGHAT